MTSAAVSGLVVGATMGVGLFLIISAGVWKTGPKTQVVTPKNSLFDSIATTLGIPRSLVVASMVILSAVSGVLAYVITQVIALAWVIAFASIWLMPAVARANAHLAHRANRNMWPDAIDAVISALRSGATIPDAIISLENHKRGLIAAPVKQFADDYRLTGNFTAALNTLKSRWGSAQSDRIVETLRLGRDIGGPEITSVLATLGSQLRSESALRQELDARQGWVRIAAKIGLLAPVIVVVVLSTRAEAVQTYNSVTGIIVISFGFLLTFLAYKLMITLGRLHSESRWLS